MIQNAVCNCSITTLTCLLKKCKTLYQLKQIHAHILITHLPTNPLAIGPLLSAAAISNHGSFFPYAKSIFTHILHPNTFMFNTMIRGYAQSRSPVAAAMRYLDMLNSGVAANNYTFPPLIKACAILHHDSKRIGCLVHAHVIEFGFADDPFVVSALVEFYSMILDMRTARMLFDRMSRRDVVLWTTMIDGYGKMGDVGNARDLFDHMPERNVISWSAMMAAYSRTSDFREVLSLFMRMQESGFSPNESVLVSVLTACAHLGALTQGLWVHSYVKMHNLDGNPILATALIDMYSKCGFIGLALSVFEAIPTKDAVAWNAIISGVALSGDAKKSLELLHGMILEGTHPNDITFVAVMSACTHAGLVQEGLEFFEKMRDVYKVKPRLEHYASAIDLLARAGMVEEAEEFIDRMGGLEQGDANVWGAVLGACRIYGNVEIGNRIWKKLADLKRADSGIHVLSYNMYKEAGMEVEAKSVRTMVLEGGTYKQPGCSVLEVNGVFQEFGAGATLLHPRARETFTMLDSLFNVINSGFEIEIEKFNEEISM